MDLLLLAISFLRWIPLVDGNELDLWNLMINKFSNYLNGCHDTRAGVVFEMIVKSF